MGLQFDAWLAADLALADRGLRELMASLIGMVRSDWSREVQFTDVASPAVRVLLDRHRVATLIPVTAVGEEQREEFRDRLVNIQATQLRIQATAIDVLERLTAAGIESRVMKGLASAELDYPQPERRHTGDVDVAIRPGDLARAAEILEAGGYRGHHRRSSNPYVVKGATFDGPRDVEVDLHDRLFVRSRYSDELFDDAGIDLTSLPGRAFGHELRLVNAAASFALTVNGNKRLSGLIDVMRILDTHDVDLDRALEIASSLRVERIVGGALTMQALLSDRPIDERWPQPDWLDRQIRFGPRRRLLLEKLARFRTMPLRAIPGYLPEWFLLEPHERVIFERGLRRATKNRRSTEIQP